MAHFRKVEVQGKIYEYKVGKRSTFVDLGMDFTKDEGYVVRLSDGFKYRDFRKSVAKFVREGHVQTTKHWRAGRSFIPNGLENA